MIFGIIKRGIASSVLPYPPPFPIPGKGIAQGPHLKE